MNQFYSCPQCSSFKYKLANNKNHQHFYILGNMYIGMYVCMPCELKGVTNQNLIKLFPMDSFFNPEDVAKALMSKSFLKSRGNLRQEGTGSQFFKDNRIRSCSYVKQCKGGLKAVPYYEKRQQNANPGRDDEKQSWNGKTFSNKGGEHAGGYRAKSLSMYNKDAQRNLMGIPDFKPPYPNSSHIEFGVRSARDTKHYKTTYRNDLITESKHIQTNNPAIQAFRNKWLRSRLQK